MAENNQTLETKKHALDALMVSPHRINLTKNRMNLAFLVIPSCNNDIINIICHYELLLT